MNLTDLHNSLPIPELRNKYEVASHYFNLNYRILTGHRVFYSDLPASVKQFVMEHGEVIVLPNTYKGEVQGCLLRPIYTKTFRYYSENRIPYGAGYADKPYSKPWVIVESCLDSDFLRQFYPYVIATLGVSVSNFLLDFLFSTAPYIVVGFDNDEAGKQAYKKLFYKYKKRVLKLDVPLGNKDFGDTLQNLFEHNDLQFELETSLIKTSLQSIGVLC